MKNYCVVHILLFLLFVLVYTCTHAQDYMVTLKGDTVRGNVKTLTFGPEKKIQVTRADKRKELFSILQTKSFMMNGELYQPVRTETTYVFMKRLTSGYLSLFAFQGEGTNTYDSRFLLKKDGTGIEVPNLSFKKVMARFLEDCGPVSIRIEQGEFTKRDLDKIISEYNACVDARTFDHKLMVSQIAEQEKKIGAWDILEEKLKGAADFEGKATSLEIVTEIRNKISKSEKVPNFIVQGLKESMAKSNLQTELDAALKEIGL